MCVCPKRDSHHSCGAMSPKKVQIFDFFALTLSQDTQQLVCVGQSSTLVQLINLHGTAMALQWQCGMLLEQTNSQQGIDLGSCMHWQMQSASHHIEGVACGCQCLVSSAKKEIAYGMHSYHSKRQPQIKTHCGNYVLKL